MRLLYWLTALALLSASGCASSDQAAPQASAQQASAQQASAQPVSAQPVSVKGSSSASSPVSLQPAASPSAIASSDSPSANACVPCGGIVFVTDSGLPAPQWQTFTAQDGRFTVDVPGPLVDEVKTGPDGLPVHGGRVRVAGDNYVLTYSRPPHPFELEKTIAGSLQHTFHATSRGGPLLGHRRSTVWTYPLPGNVLARHLTWTDGRDLLQLIVVAARQTSAGERFFSSLRLR